MSNPITTLKNYYYNKLKNSCIETPEIICDDIYKVLSDAGYKFKNILDPCCGINKNLTKPFESKGVRIYNYDIIYDVDFLSLERIDFVPDLVICNPPFNWSVDLPIKYKRKSLPYLFLQKIVELTSIDTSIILFVPSWFFGNMRMSSERFFYFLEGRAPKLS
jgi:type I restriction-modification system DNA methylase subunit